MKPYSDCTASAGTTGHVAVAVERTLRGGPGQLVERHHGGDAAVGALHLGDRRRPEGVADDGDPLGAAGGRRTTVARAVVEPPERVGGVGDGGILGGVAVGLLRGGVEEAQRVLGADDEVGQLLRRDARAAGHLAVLRLGERVAERQGVDRPAVVGQRLAGALTLHVVGQHDVAALGEVLGEPLVHPLRALHRALGQHDAGERAAQPLAGVRVLGALERGVDVAAEQRAEAVGERDRTDPTAGALPVGARRVADVPAREELAGGDGRPGRRSDLGEQLGEAGGRDLGGERREVRRVAQLATGAGDPAVGVGDVLGVPGGVRRVLRASGLGGGRTGGAAGRGQGAGGHEEREGGEQGASHAVSTTAPLVSDGVTSSHSRGSDPGVPAEVRQA